ncbi:MAG: glycosyltransferase [Coriobacteriia bacterium]|nr:glycosyltransferase [Coriobacteriia bacterium]
MNPLTIVIPTYERPQFLADTLASIETQTRRDFDLVVLDNGSLSSYSQVLERFSSLGIEYIRNESNIGSGPNQTKAREICSRTEFGMVFHDDDIMHPRLVEWELGFLEEHADAAWIAAECQAFADGLEPPVETWSGVAGAVELHVERASLVRWIMDDTMLHFGSTMYRSSALLKAESYVAELERFHIVGDRPYLLEVAKSGSTALIREPLVLYRLHAAQDTHDPNLTDDQAIALMHYYRDVLLEAPMPGDADLLARHATNYLLHVHSVTARENNGSLRELVARERADGLFRWRSLNGQGVGALARMMGLGRAFESARPALSAVRRVFQPRR